VFCQEFLHLGFKPFLLSVQLWPGPAALFGRIGGQFEAIQGKEGIPDEVHLLADQQDIPEQWQDLRFIEDIKVAMVL
jgi:hypothetical protein